MSKTVEIDEEEVDIDENYYVLFKILEKILNEVKRK
jgi:hypothetical protein